ncbi:jg3871 [Pararge aegeria aegeria]|uniref:Jg3871 protein n=1 Tax=Pararge aegeria aegeria TaxID=348720 RepID=A0A8S4S5H2_9NEOP|nr:jg3871 [Pararge aegeria aegeria]
MSSAICYIAANVSMLGVLAWYGRRLWPWLPTKTSPKRTVVVAELFVTELVRESTTALLISAVKLQCCSDMKLKTYASG